MAKAKVVKSKRGNDLVVLTLGPKEVATTIDALWAGEGPYAEDIATALCAAREKTSNAKDIIVDTKVEFVPVVR